VKVLYSQYDWKLCANKVRLQTNYKPSVDMMMRYSRGHSLEQVAKMTAKSQHILQVHKSLKERQGVSGSFQVRGAMQVVIEALLVELKGDA
jgi:hypothetical protein